MRCMACARAASSASMRPMRPPKPSSIRPTSRSYRSSAAAESTRAADSRRGRRKEDSSAISSEWPFELSPELRRALVSWGQAWG